MQLVQVQREPYGALAGSFPPLPSSDKSLKLWTSDEIIALYSTQIWYVTVFL